MSDRGDTMFIILDKKCDIKNREVTHNFRLHVLVADVLASIPIELYRPVVVLEGS